MISIFQISLEPWLFMAMCIHIQYGEYLVCVCMEYHHELHIYVTVGSDFV